MRWTYLSIATGQRARKELAVRFKTTPRRLMIGAETLHFAASSPVAENDVVLDMRIRLGRRIASKRRSVTIWHDAEPRWYL